MHCCLIVGNLFQNLMPADYAVCFFQYTRIKLKLRVVRQKNCRYITSTFLGIVPGAMEF